MTSRLSKLGAASYETETSWAESTDTFATRLQIHGEPIVPSDLQMRIAEPITQQYAEEGKMGVRGPWQGEFTVNLPLTGHGGVTTGALTETHLCGLLGNVLVGKNTAQVGGVVAASPTSASQFAVTGGTRVAGALIRVGSLGDNRGNGQFAVVNNASTITLLTALDATPNAADVVYASQVVYPSETPSTFSAITSTRWLLQTANGQWKARGCFPTSMVLSGLNVGEMPMVAITFSVSRWEIANSTFPSTVATAAKDAAIVAAGSTFLQTKGTATRQKLSHRNLAINIEFGSQPLMGPGGVDGYQTIIGAIRTRAAATFSLTVDAPTTGTTTMADIFTGGNFQHCLISLSVSDGKALGFYFPNARPTNYLTQESVDGLNRQTINFDALTDTAATGALPQSSWRLAMG